MKRFFSSFIIFMLIAASISCIAEGFVIRNNIMFGDTKEDILAKETLEIDKINEGETTVKIITVEGTVAGVDSSYIIYTVGEKGLYNVDYIFRDSPLQPFIDHDYTNINDGLIRKYGEPIDNSDGSVEASPDGAIDSISQLVEVGKMFGMKADMTYNEWLIDGEQSQIKIEHVKSELTDSKGSSFKHQLSYTCITEEYLQHSIDVENEKKATIDNDL